MITYCIDTSCTSWILQDITLNNYAHLLQYILSLHLSLNLDFYVSKQKNISKMTLFSDIAQRKTTLFFFPIKIILRKYVLLGYFIYTMSKSESKYGKTINFASIRLHDFCTFKPCI